MVEERPAGERFVLRSEIGAGGMGMVYRVLDRERGEEVALKTLRTASGRDLYRFKREFRALADLTHPNLVVLHEMFIVGDEWMFTMELIDGVPFHRWVRPLGPDGTGIGAGAHGDFDARSPMASRTGTSLADARLDEPRLRAAMVQLVDGLCALHGANKVHRDLKPSNVLVEREGRVVILDFGLVADVDHLGIDRTHEQTAVGTPAYMSPEQSADRALTPASDWYSVGTMLYEVLAGRRPFEGRAAEVIVAKQKRDPLPIRDLVRDAPSDLSDLAMRMLARDPHARPDGHQILAALGATASPWTERIAERAAHLQPVGRDAQLALLRRALVDSRAHTVSALVLGPCGSGKTTLIDAFVDELRSAGEAVVLSGKASDREALPFRAIDRIIDSLGAYLMSLSDADAAAIVPPGIAALARVFPALRRVPAAQVPILPGSLPSDEGELRRRAFVAMCDVFRAIAARHPLCIPLDDMQWGTAAGSRVMNDFFEGPDAPRCLIIFGHRSENPDSPLLEHLRIWNGDLRTITLDPLPPL